tara:strand:+ start:33 stop:236 length:204 start_codon:yes stop_codon:yes gene_type:complete
LATRSLSLRGTAGAFVALDALSLVSARDAPVSPVFAVDSASNGARGILDDDDADASPLVVFFVGDGM